MLSGAADVHALVLAEDAAEQEALLCRHHTIIQLHLEEAGRLFVLPNKKCDAFTCTFSQMAAFNPYHSHQTYDGI